MCNDFQICRYLDDAPDDPEGILLFGTLNLILNTVLVDSDSTSDIAVLKFYIECHCSFGEYVVPPDICGEVNFSDPAVRLSLLLARLHGRLPREPGLAGSPSVLQRAQCSHCNRSISYGNSVCPSVCLSVCPSVRPSVTRRYCVKTTARSAVQFAPLDSKMCLVL